MSREAIMAFITEEILKDVKNLSTPTRTWGANTSDIMEMKMHE